MIGINQLLLLSAQPCVAQPRSTSSLGAKLKPAFFAAIIGALISKIAGKLEPLRTVATAPVAPGQKIFQAI